MMQLDAMQCQTLATGPLETGNLREGKQFCLTVWPGSAGCHYLKVISLIFRIRLRPWPDLNSSIGVFLCSSFARRSVKNEHFCELKLG